MLTIGVIWSAQALGYVVEGEKSCCRSSMLTIISLINGVTWCIVSWVANDITEWTYFLQILCWNLIWLLVSLIMLKVVCSLGGRASGSSKCCGILATLCLIGSAGLSTFFAAIYAFGDA